MDRIHHATAAASPPSVDAFATAGYPTPGNPGSGTPATVLTAWVVHQLIEEMRAVIEATGITPDKSVVTQLRQSMRRLAGGNVATVTATGSLTADQAGLVLVSAAGGNVTLTLPAANGAGGTPLPFTFVRTDTSSNSVTIQRAGSDTIEGQTTLAIPLSGRTTIRSDGTSTWRVTSEANQGRTLARPGWYRLPGGLIVQWGVASVGAGATATVTYPVAFPNAALAGAVTPGGASPGTFPVTFNITSAPASASQFQISNNGAGTGALDWIVLGH